MQVAGRAPCCSLGLPLYLLDVAILFACISVGWLWYRLHFSLRCLVYIVCYLSWLAMGLSIALAWFAMFWLVFSLFCLWCRLGFHGLVHGLPPFCMCWSMLACRCFSCLGSLVVHWFCFCFARFCYYLCLLFYRCGYGAGSIFHCVVSLFSVWYLSWPVVVSPNDLAWFSLFCVFKNNTTSTCDHWMSE